MWKLKKNFTNLQIKLTNTHRLILWTLFFYTVILSAVSFPKEKLSVEIKSKNIMSVNVPEMKFVKEEMEGSIFPYGFVQTSAELDDTVIKLQKVLDNLLSLAEIEKSCQLMADEIEKTRRRVNALEYSTIPNLEETVKDIRMKLDENERATITRLMKVKQMLEKNN